jgi:hypothetical protein
MEDKIITAFATHYRDLGWYRWQARNPKFMQVFYPSLWALALIGALIGFFPLTIGAGGLFILSIMVGAVDHMMIGRSKRKIERQLKRVNINVSWEEACKIAGIS